LVSDVKGKKHRLKVGLIENRLQRRIFGCKRDCNGRRLEKTA
jgi:hypothetical protein